MDGGLESGGGRIFGEEKGRELRTEEEIARALRRRREEIAMREVQSLGLIGF